MSAWLDVLRLLADPTRLRLLALLRAERLSVAEIQDILSMGQSRISMQLALLRKASLLVDRREGKNVFYARPDDLDPSLDALIDATLQRAGLEPDLARDRSALRTILTRRKERNLHHFNALAGRGGRNACPGRGADALLHALLEMLPPLDIADLGCGDGEIARLLARRARRVIGVDQSAKMVALARDRALKAGIANIEFREGDIEDPPIDAESVDVTLFSQALHHAANPRLALEGAHRILKPCGRLIVLDLKQHQFDAARELYGDTWLGFSDDELRRSLRQVGFDGVELAVLPKDADPPHLVPLLARAVKPDRPG